MIWPNRIAGLVNTKWCLMCRLTTHGAFQIWALYDVCSLALICSSSGSCYSSGSQIQVSWWEGCTENKCWIAHVLGSTISWSTLILYHDWSKQKWSKQHLAQHNAHGDFFSSLWPFALTLVIFTLLWPACCTANSSLGYALSTLCFSKLMKTMQRFPSNLIETLAARGQNSEWTKFSMKQTFLWKPIFYYTCHSGKVRQSNKNGSSQYQVNFRTSHLSMKPP